MCSQAAPRPPITEDKVSRRGSQRGPQWEKARSQPCSQFPPPLRGEDNPASWLREGRRMCTDKTKARACRKPHRTFSRVQSVSSGPGLLPSCPAPQHSCLNHTEAARPATAEACPYPLTFPTRVQTVNPLGDRGQAPTGRKGSRLNSHPKTVSAPPQAGGSPLSDSWWLAG